MMWDFVLWDYVTGRTDAACQKQTDAKKRKKNSWYLINALSLCPIGVLAVVKPAQNRLGLSKSNGFQLVNLKN